MVINHIGISGGKDSTALFLWALYESGYPRESIVVSFCDTDNEHELTYEHVRRLGGLHPITWLTMEAFMVARGRPAIKGFYELAKWKKRFPGVKSRFCTQFLKIYPTQYFIACLQALLGCEIVIHSGVRANESFERGKLVQREEVRPGLTEYRPLLRWTLDDVWAIHKRYGIDPNPLYEMGAKRVGCLPCIMSRKAEVANIATRWPERIEQIKAHELSVPNRVGYSSFFPRKTVPPRYRSVPFKSASGKIVNVCTIHDVVRWALDGKALDEAKALNAKRQMELELDTTADDRTACQSSWGNCE